MASGSTGLAVHGGGDCSETASFKSWPLQAQESYQLQLALALRLSSQAASADDPNFLDFKIKSHDSISTSASAQSISHRFWVNGCLSYSDKIPDGFYLIHGMDPYAWNISTDQGSSGRVPSLESLKDIDPHNDSSVNVVLIDKLRDPGLKELQHWVLCLSSSWLTTVDVIQQLATLVCTQMGGEASTEEELATQWNDCTKALRDCIGSIVIPIGYLSTGLCVHRALLFKILADIVNLPCRIVKGCKYCSSDAGASCLVQFGSEKEYLVDLLQMPGVLSQPDSSLNSALSTLVSSPLCHPKFKSVKTMLDFQTLARLYFFDCQSLAHAFDDVSSGTAKNTDEKEGPRITEGFNMNYFRRNNAVPSSFNKHKSSASPLLQRSAWNATNSRDHQRLVFSDPFPNIMDSTFLVQDFIQPRHIRPSYNRDAPPVFSNHVHDTSSREFYLGKDTEEDSNIQWNELVLMKKIGSVEVSPAASEIEYSNNLRMLLSKFSRNKIFMQVTSENFLRSGCLYKVLRMPDAAVILDERLRLNMAYDVANGMNYLHQLKPPIVHRDLKSPNLLVDSTYTVKVCDFGLSRSKVNTFLSSKTAAGTPEWMAPEVLLDEPSNEKSDVYSFGVILWELMTLRQPWCNLSAAQVVAAVGFNNRRLEIPPHVNPQVAALIEICWAK
ncbi:Serine/threonine-protein kinase [Morus notabilis]|uniref:Serine/threonine-protein kinase n=1 Tax=Morus notabilis TaxID=981085 RepID=W9S4F1_9ROSA|nr:Serine/threonine-protein kinase [Morus notabilis]